MDPPTLTPAAAGAAGPGTESQPYKFLDYFEESDRESFAGRDRDAQECLDRITTQRVFVLYARSGYGKTSLLKAGLFPRLRAQGLRPVYIRTLQDPVRDLHAALLAEAGQALASPLDAQDGVTESTNRPAPDGRSGGNGRDAGSGAGSVIPSLAGGDGSGASQAPGGPGVEQDLEQLIRRLPSTGRIVLVLDQFEEFFILFRDDPKTRAAFVDTIRNLVMESSLEIHVVFSLREDYLAELDEFQGAIPRLFDRCYRLLPLTPFGAREAIIRPLKRHGIAYSPSLVTRMVEELDRVHLDPPLIQIFCTEVYKKAASRGAEHTELTEKDVESVGGLDEIFRRYLSDVTNDRILLADPLLARCTLDALLTQENTKRAATLEQLSRARFRASPQEIEPILSVFVQRFLVRRSLANGVERFELIHERLVPFIQEWLDQDPDYVNFWIARDLITYTSRGEYWRKQTNLLLNEGQIEGVIKPFRGRLDLNPMETEFVFLSALDCRSGEAGYWGDRLDLRKSVPIVLEALTGNDRTRRLGAASVAGSMTDPTGVIQRACGEFSGESDPEIRRAAARSYSRLIARYGRVRVEKPVASTASEPSTHDDSASGPVYRATRAPADLNDAEGREKATRNQGVEQPALKFVRSFLPFLAHSISAVRNAPGHLRRWLRALLRLRSDLNFLAFRAEGGDDLADVAYLLRVRARSIVADRLCKAQAASITAYCKKGAVAGAIAGFVWVIVAGSPSLLFYLYLQGAPINPSISWMAVLPVVLAAVGWAVGYTTCLADARDAVAAGRAFHPLRLLNLNSRSFVAILAIPALLSACEVALALLMPLANASSPSTDIGYSTSTAIVYTTIGVFGLLLMVVAIFSPYISRWWRIALAFVLVCPMPLVIPWLRLQEPFLMALLIPFCVAWLGLFVALTEGMIHITMRCARVRGHLPAGRISWSWVVWDVVNSVTLPLSLLALFCLAARAMDHPVSPTVLAAVALGFVVAVGVPARLYASRLVPLEIRVPDNDPSPSTLARGFCLTTLLLAPIAFNSIWGLDTIPQFAHRYELGPEGLSDLHIQVGPAYPDVSHATLNVAMPQIIRISHATGLVNGLTIEPQHIEYLDSHTRISLGEGDWLLLPARQYTLQLMASYNSARPAIQGVDLHLARVEFASSEGLEWHGAETGERPIAITLVPDDRGVWRGRVSVKAPAGPAGSRPRLRLIGVGTADATFEDLQAVSRDSLPAQTGHSLNRPATRLWPATVRNLNGLGGVRSLRNELRPNAFAPELGPTPDGWALTIEGRRAGWPAGMAPKSMDLYGYLEMFKGSLSSPS
jgi:hypothetical protein